MTTDNNINEEDKLPECNEEEYYCLNSTTSDDQDCRQDGEGLQPNKPDYDVKFCVRILRHFIRRFLRGFANGVFLHFGVQVVVALLRNPTRHKISKLLQGHVFKNCSRLALFCALYPSIYHLLVDVLSILQKHKNGWTYGISGGIAGLSIAVLDKSGRQTVTFITLSRALAAGLTTLVTRGHVPAIPFGEIVVFSACVSVILYGAFLKPQYLNQGYYRSLLKWSQTYTDKILQGACRDASSRFQTCQECGFHESSCVQHEIMVLLYSLPNFAKLYLPIYIIPTILFKRKMFRHRPLHVLKTLAKNIVLSTLCLDVMISLARSTVCLLRNISHSPSPLPSYIPLVSGAVCGISLLIERYSRRKEQCLFVVPQALTMLYNIAKLSSIWPYIQIPHGFTLTFALSMMSVMHSYELETDSLSMLVNGVLKFLLGQDPVVTWILFRFEMKIVAYPL